MKKILVTGGAGCLGSRLCDRLIENQDDVLLVDNFFTGDKRNVMHLVGNYFLIKLNSYWKVEI